jgi:hypothetical protein
MIEDPLPDDWHDLQSGVARILREIGLTVEENKLVATPRGSIALDVYAVDTGSVDQISYIVECKNWSKRVEQTVVHSFTTVMAETGANIGFIVSKYGLQEGAEKYTQNTNIRGFTFQDFQARYLPIWLERYFMPTLGNAADALVQYTDPINSQRAGYESALTSDQALHFAQLLNRYASLGEIMILMRGHPFLSLLYPHLGRPSADFSDYKKVFQEVLDGTKVLKAQTYRGLLHELLDAVAMVTNEFNAVFGKNIFTE